MALPLMWTAIRSMARWILTMVVGAAGTMAGIMATATTVGIMATWPTLVGVTVSQGMPASPDTAAEATADDAELQRLQGQDCIDEGPLLAAGRAPAHRDGA